MATTLLGASRFIPDNSSHRVSARRKRSSGLVDGHRRDIDCGVSHSLRPSAGLRNSALGAIAYNSGGELNNGKEK